MVICEYCGGDLATVGGLHSVGLSWI